VADEIKTILTKEEAARVVGADPTDARLTDVLPQVDADIKQATGRDGTADDPIKPEAKRAARIQLALEYDLMTMQPNQIEALNRALVNALVKLEYLVEDSSTAEVT